MIEFLALYLDGELPPESRRAFDEHLAECAACVRYLNSYKATIAMGRVALQSDDTPAPSSVPQGLIAAIRAARARA
jgi:anti-sigma factor RsiW